MKKTILAVIMCVVYLMCFTCTKTYCIRCRQVSNEYVVEFLDSEDIAHTVNGLWNVFNVLGRSSRSSVYQPEDALDLMVQVLGGNGVGLETFWDGRSIACLLAGAILQSCPGGCKCILEPDCESGRQIHWYYPVKCGTLRDTVYRFVETFKYYGYNKGDNNYISLRFTRNRVNGDPPGLLKYVGGPFTLSARRGEIGAAVQNVIARTFTDIFF